MDGFSDVKSFYVRFVKSLQPAWTVIRPVVAADGVCRLQELSDGADGSCSCLPLIPLKKILLPPKELLWKQSEDGSPVSFSPANIALIDVAPCDLYALDYLDQAYAEDSFYQQRRRNLLVIGRACSPSSSCQCPPHAAPPPFDLFFADNDIWSGSEQGEKVLQDFSGAVTSKVLPETYWAGQKTLPTKIAARFLQSVDNPVWAEVASRCLSCGACSAVCPTCACYDIVDEVALSGVIRRQRVWDNCFFRDHGLVAGGHNFRPDRTARLRFRFEHKYLGFGEQRGIISCVGCGRCQQICPVGIDLAQILDQLPLEEEE
ncbi:MAG: 4Fe-4S ferredoxin [Deltaproteobacteria bacterium HGW-Deltaproteobacteria-4]|nr:MAG: 4Fe-4S ferredoxin [Deltaproteobacteria bacterium HGW-Deltaproteobacteria-4]